MQIKNGKGITLQIYGNLVDMHICWVDPGMIGKS